MAGVSKAAVTGWVKAADENGFESLNFPKHKVRPSKLTDDQLKKIEDIKK